MLSKTQIDRLGERLKQGPVTQADLRLLDEYVLRFRAPYVEVHARLEAMGLEPIGRFHKSLPSIVDKLRRESIRLTQIQDIVGCRVIVLTASLQEDRAREIAAAFPVTRLIDRRTAPSHGYRAIHALVDRGGFVIEVQIRTEMQHWWARTSEALADEFGSDLKYGGGPEPLRNALSRWSEAIGCWEAWLMDRGRRRRATLEEVTEVERQHLQAVRGQVDVLAVAQALRRRRAGNDCPD